MPHEPTHPLNDSRPLPASASRPTDSTGCARCRDGTTLGFQISFAFQPIVDLRNRKVFAYEALVRGPNQESAHWVLSQINDDNRYIFDQTCRVQAIRLAAALGMRESLSINFLPNAVYEPAACIRQTLAAAREHNFPTERLIFEFTEGERLGDWPHLIRIFQEYRRHGFRSAIDDFGAGYAGLNLLAEFQPDILKIDMELVRNIDTHKAKQEIVKGIMAMGAGLGVQVIAEGVETAAERDYLRGIGVELMQGYFFCRPAFEALGQVDDGAWCG